MSVTNFYKIVQITSNRIDDSLQQLLYSTCLIFDFSSTRSKGNCPCETKSTLLGLICSTSTLESAPVQSCKSLKATLETLCVRFFYVGVPIARMDLMSPWTFFCGAALTPTILGHSAHPSLSSCNVVAITVDALRSSNSLIDVASVALLRNR